MQLHELKSFRKAKKRRVGRGGKRGTYSGRGQKGQKARAGHRIRPAERDLIQRLPKLRGAKNRSRAPRPVVINLGDLEKFAEDSLLNKEVLLRRGLIGKITTDVKILGSGEVNKSFTVRGVRLSKKAKEKLEAAGGTVK